MKSQQKNGKNNEKLYYQLVWHLSPTLNAGMWLVTIIILSTNTQDSTYADEIAERKTMKTEHTLKMPEESPPSPKQKNEAGLRPIRPIAWAA